MTVFGVPRAILSAKARIVKSFLRVWGKLFTILLVFLRQSSSATTILTPPCAKVVVRRRIKVVPAPLYPPARGLSSFFCGNAPKSSKNREVLGGCEKIRENLGKTRKKFLTLRPRARPPGIHLRNFSTIWGKKFLTS